LLSNVTEKLKSSPTNEVAGALMVTAAVWAKSGLSAAGNKTKAKAKTLLSRYHDDKLSNPCGLTLSLPWKHAFSEKLCSFQ
jgi:hypothetical protein